MSSVQITVTPSGFPGAAQTANRSRLKAAQEMAEFSGGKASNEQLNRAKLSWDSAVSQYNRYVWNFNRVEQDITFVSNTPTYTLNTDFAAPFRGLLLDTNNRTVVRIGWIPYGEWLTFDPNQISGAATPNLYTIRNEQNEGLVTFVPFPFGTSFPFPKARIHYFRWIAKAATDPDTLNVPRDVDEAIFQLALSLFLQKVDGRQAQLIRQQADGLLLDVEQRWRGFQDHWSPYYDT